MLLNMHASHPLSEDQLLQKIKMVIRVRTKGNIHICSNWGLIPKFWYRLFCFTLLLRVEVLKYVSKSGLDLLFYGQIVIYPLCVCVRMNTF
jgi:hypothetical protein